MSLIYTTSIISLHLKPLPENSNSWVFFWLISLAIIILITKLFFPKKTTNSLLAIISSKAMSILKSEGYIITNIVNILLITVYIFSLGILISAISSHYYLSKNTINLDFVLSFKFSSIIAILLALKVLVIIITQWIYQAKDIAINYLNILILSYNTFGLIIYLGLWIIFYVNFNIGLILISIPTGIIFIIRLLKLSSLAESKNNFNLFSFIVYICTVEILPLIIAQKVYFYWVLES